MTSNFVKQTLVERWDGIRWTVVPSAGVADGHPLAINSARH